MKKVENFYKWWTEKIKGQAITNEEMEIIIEKLT